MFEDDERPAVDSLLDIIRARQKKILVYEKALKKISRKTCRGLLSGDDGTRCGSCGSCLAAAALEKAKIL